MQRVRKDHLSDEEIQNWTCSRSSTIMVQNFSQTFAIYRPNNNVFVLQNSLYNVYVNSSSHAGADPGFLKGGVTKQWL